MNEAEKIFKMYLDYLMVVSERDIFDSYRVLELFDKESLSKIADISLTAKRYQSMIREYLDKDPRVQTKLDFGTLES